MNLQNFETNDVIVYKEASVLIEERNRLENIIKLLKNNYDSKLMISAKAHTDHNENEYGSSTLDIPLGIIFDIPLSKADIEVRINSRLYDISESLLRLKNMLK